MIGLSCIIYCKAHSKVHHTLRALYKSKFKFVFSFKIEILAQDTYFTEFGKLGRGNQLQSVYDSKKEFYFSLFTNDGSY